jgi:thymidylate kinase
MQIINSLNSFATYGIEPDVTIVLGQVSSHANTQRVNERGELDRIELEDCDFHERVAGYFANLPHESSRLHFVDTSGSKVDSAREIIEVLSKAAPGIFCDKRVIDEHLVKIASAKKAD